MNNAAILPTTFEPGELAYLQRFFDDVCKERGVEGAGPVATSLAARIIQLYQQGVRDRSDLRVRLEGFANPL